MNENKPVISKLPQTSLTAINLRDRGKRIIAAQKLCILLSQLRAHRAIVRRPSIEQLKVIFITAQKRFEHSFPEERREAEFK